MKTELRERRCTLQGGGHRHVNTFGHASERVCFCRLDSSNRWVCACTPAGKTREYDIATRLYNELNYATHSIHTNMHEQTAFQNDVTLHVPLLDCPHENCVKRVKLLNEYLETFKHSQAAPNKPMIIHIDQDRYARILEQGYNLFRHIQPKIISVQQAEGDIEYHTLQGERGTCAVCGVEADSVDAETPVDLQYIEMAMREPDKTKAGEIMDYMRAMRLRTPGRITDEYERGVKDGKASVYRSHTSEDAR